MSDLQCAATFLILPPAPAISSKQLRAGRLACLYAESGVDAAALARDLGVVARDLPEPATPAAPATIAALTAAFADLADEFRGETLAVVVSDATYTGLTREVLPAGPAPPAVVVEIDGESHRWRPYA